MAFIILVLIRWIRSTSDVVRRHRLSVIRRPHSVCAHCTHTARRLTDEKEIMLSGRSSDEDTSRTHERPFCQQMRTRFWWEKERSHHCFFTATIINIYLCEKRWCQFNSMHRFMAMVSFDDAEIGWRYFSVGVFSWTILPTIFSIVRGSVVVHCEMRSKRETSAIISVVGVSGPMFVDLCVSLLHHGAKRIRTKLSTTARARASVGVFVCVCSCAHHKMMTTYQKGQANAEESLNASIAICCGAWLQVAT